MRIFILKATNMVYN